MRSARAKRRDANEMVIVKALEEIGASVTRLDGDGIPDLLVGLDGKTHLLEVKLPLGPKGGLPEHREHEGGKGDLTKAQVAWWSSWTGDPAVVVRSPAEAIAAITTATDPGLQASQQEAL